MNSAPLEIWVKRFKKFIIPFGLNDKLIYAFLNYLADLKIFNVLKGNIWKVNEPPDNWDERGVATFIKKLNKIAETEKGFAVGYFLRGKKSNKTLKLDENFEIKHTQDQYLLKKTNVPKKSSNLSNLQIVNKIEKQLSPYLDFEKKFLKNLTGIYTNKNDAYLIYSYILTQTLPKSRPRVWEQLSRRRHK